MYMIQNVINKFKKINPIIRDYSLALLLTRGKKNCASMSRSTNISNKKLYSFLANHEKHIPAIQTELIAITKKLKHSGESITTIMAIDPTNFIKSYSQKIEKVGYDRAGSTGHVERCLVPVYAAIIDADGTTVPLHIDFWAQKKVTGEKKYRSKVDITIELIKWAMENDVHFDAIVLDGAFATPTMLKFFQQHFPSIKFIIRIPKNRKIETAGVKETLKNHPALKLHRNQREKTIQAQIYGASYFLTVQKRKKKGGGNETIFFISNIDEPAKEQIRIYNLRWPIEKVNRTTKQKFGTDEAQVLDAAKQKAHVMASFLVYAILNTTLNSNKKRNVDALVNVIRNLYFNDVIDPVKGGLEIQYRAMRSLDAPLVQNHIQNFLHKFEQVGAFI
jgi:hypothetical protein